MLKEKAKLKEGEEKARKREEAREAECELREKATRDECEQRLCEKDVEITAKQAAKLEVEIEWNAAKDALKNHQLLVRSVVC